MNRRKFLQLAAGAGVVATATVAEAGFFAEFMSWVKRRPAWSIPKITSAEVLQYSDYASFTDLAVETAIDNKFVGIIHPFLVKDLMGDEFSSVSLSHLSLYGLSTLYYDKKAMENLKGNMAFSDACREIEASVIRAKLDNNTSGMPLYKPSANQRTIVSPSGPYTKNDNYETCKVVYNNETHKIDLLPTTSLAFKT